MSSTFRQFDFYPKLSDEFRIKTLHGGMISIVAIVTIIILFISELNYYLTTEVADTLYVDVSHDELLRINFDIEFPVLPCTLMSIDAMDLSGNHQIGVTHHISKQSIDMNGNTIGEKQSQQLAQQNKIDDSDNGVKQQLQQKMSQPDYCGSCYGASIIPNQCCQSCDEVKNVYRQRGWSIPPLSTIEQCIASGQIMEEGAAQLAAKEGCHITGYLEVNKVAGNLYVINYILYILSLSLSLYIYIYIYIYLLILI